MELSRFRFFLAVAECGSFSQAANDLGVKQPSVSAGIQRLERTIGGALFERTRPVRLTALGHELKPVIAQLLAAVDRMEQLIGNPAGNGAAVDLIVPSDIVPSDIEAPAVAAATNGGHADHPAVTVAANGGGAQADHPPVVAAANGASTHAGHPATNGADARARHRAVVKAAHVAHYTGISDELAQLKANLAALWRLSDR